MSSLNVSSYQIQLLQNLYSDSCLRLYSDSCLSLTTSKKKLIIQSKGAKCFTLAKNNEVLKKS